MKRRTFSLLPALGLIPTGKARKGRPAEIEQDVGVPEAARRKMFKRLDEALEFVREWVRERPNAVVLAADDPERLVHGWSAFRVVMVDGKREEEKVLVGVYLTNISKDGLTDEEANLMRSGEGRRKLAASLMTEGRRRAGYVPPSDPGLDTWGLPKASS